MRSNRYIRFTGEYSKLKSLGYEFQRLFAGNYMQWHKDGVRVWKRGAEVTIDRLTNYEGEFLEFLLECRRTDTKLVSRWKTVGFYLNSKTGAITVDRAGYRAQMDAMGGDVDLEWIWSQVGVSPELIKRIMEWYDMGWIKVSIFPLQS
jgi:hypothetical protein